MKKLLMVEDDELVAGIYGRKLANEGFVVQVAADGPRALEILRTFNPDVVMVDLMLPSMSGVELTRKIRTLPQLETVPVIVLSNTYLMNVVQDAWRAGATRCLSKASCTPKEILKVINSVLGKTEPAAEPGNAASTSQEQAAIDPDEASSRAALLLRLPAVLNRLRGELQALVKTQDVALRMTQIHRMYSEMHGVAGSAAATQMRDLAQLSSALEVLLKELFEKPAAINSSTQRTAATAIDLLALLAKRPEQPDEKQPAPARILLVDDDSLSRRAVSYALERAKLECIGIEDPAKAQTLLAEMRFDLILLDINLPGVSGYDICRKLRTLPLHKKTPVIFVTSVNDFGARAMSTMCGGNDLIAKPFLFIELAVKALVHILRGRLEAANASAARANAA